MTKALGGDVIVSDGTPLPEPTEDFWADEKFEVRRAACLPFRTLKLHGGPLLRAWLFFISEPLLLQQS